MSLGISFPRLAKPHTRRFESGLIDLAVDLDDVDLTSGAVGKCGDLPDVWFQPIVVAQWWNASMLMMVWLGVMAKPLVSALLSSALHSCSKMADLCFVK